MDLSLITLLVDTALFILVWIVQLVIYPGFLYYKEEDIKRWHRPYTTRITVIVFPLMAAQLGLYAMAAYSLPTALTIAMFAFVIATWAITFFKAVPLHNAIDKNENSFSQREKLVHINWTRTVIWTIILMVSIINYGK